MITIKSKRHPDPEIRRSQRVLLMVHELHKRGYQRLRIVPGMSPSGAYWRCSITPITNILITHGALWQDFNRDVAHYSSGSENRYFEWEDAKQDTARNLASKFIKRFPEITRKGSGSDWTYAGWYVEMLGLAERGHLPVAYSDWPDDHDERHLLTISKDNASEEQLLLPPPGEAEPTRDTEW